MESIFIILLLLKIKEAETIVDTLTEKVAEKELLFFPLTNREYEILKLLITGKSNTEIAERLFISPHTVKMHVRTILCKMSVKGRVQAAVKAIRDGLV